MTTGEQPSAAGLLDTSVFVARERGRPLGRLPAACAISVVTLAELHLGVLMADEAATRSRRLRTLTSVEATFAPLPIDSTVARRFGELVARARLEGRRPGIMDAWIAATALVHSLPVYTQDEGFQGLPDLEVVRV